MEHRLQQQQQQAAMQEVVTALANSVLRLWVNLAAQIEAGSSSSTASFLTGSKDSLQAVLPVISLTAVVHRAVAEAGNPWANSLCVTEFLVNALQLEIAANGRLEASSSTHTHTRQAAAAAAAPGSSTAAGQQLQHWQQLLHSPKLLWLLLLSQALYAQHLQEAARSNHQSSSSSSSRGQAPAAAAAPAHHEQVFAALGVSASSAQGRGVHSPYSVAGKADLAVRRTAVVAGAVLKQLAMQFTLRGGLRSSAQDAAAP
jgi:hypothetical protein